MKTLGKHFDIRSVLLSGLQAMLMVFWLYNLNKFELVSKAGVVHHKYDGVNVLCIAIACLGMWDNLRSGFQMPKKSMGVICAVSGLFSVATLMANYPTFEPFSNPKNLVNFLGSLPGGFAVCFHILVFGVRRLPFPAVAEKKRRMRNHPGVFYLVTFGSILTVYFLYFFCVAFPGYFSEDSYQSIYQCLSGSYNNLHPIWYTLYIKLCMSIGAWLGGEGNTLFCVYGIIQCLMMAAVFAYALTTLYEAGMPKVCIGIVFCMYTFLTYNLAYSATMWKDIPFSVAALLIVASMFRILRGIGKYQRRDLLLFILGSVIFCLMRTNGWYSYLLAGILMSLGLWKYNRKLVYAIGGVLAGCWICLNPVLNVMGVAEGDFVEALAVPFQQVARVLADGYEIPESDMEMLEEIFYVDRVIEVYDPLTVDPVKFEAFRKSQREYFKENIGEYARLWLRLGRQYPWEYTKAWIDETVGFWNAGYHYWIFHDGGENPELGIVRPELDNPIKDGFASMFYFLQSNPLTTQIFYSIGFHVWVLIFCFLVNWLRKREEYLLAIPCLVLVVGLWFGTPVFAEFRYAYPVFLTVPILLCLTVFRSAPEKGEGENEKK